MFPLESPGGKSILFPFPDSRGCVSWPTAPPSIFRVHPSNLWFPCHIYLLLILWPSSCDYILAHSGNPGESLHLQNLNHICKVPFAMEGNMFINARD